MNTPAPSPILARGLRVAGWLALAAAVGFALVWAFLAYLSPDMVLDFASLMQMCGMPLSR
jgi:hypothetical protein